MVQIIVQRLKEQANIHGYLIIQVVCTDYGCNISDSSNWGYWTSIPYKDNTINVWVVNSYGSLTLDYVTRTVVGIRPVITISKSNI